MLIRRPATEQKRHPRCAVGYYVLQYRGIRSTWIPVSVNKLQFGWLQCSGANWRKFSATRDAPAGEKGCSWLKTWTAPLYCHSIPLSHLSIFTALSFISVAGSSGGFRMGDKPIWEQIGSSFVQHYYQLFDTDRTQLGAIYVSSSWDGIPLALLNGCSLPPPKKKIHQHFSVSLGKNER